MHAMNSVNRRGIVKKLQIGHKAKVNKQKEVIPNPVANGNTVILVISHFINPHFSSNLRTLQAKIVV